MKINHSFKSNSGKDTISASIWECENPKMVLQIVHGMCEHIGRYEDFANYLNKYGIIVAGENHLGHGESATILGYISKNNGAKYLREDVREFNTYLKEKYKLPTYILGHSMGSFILRDYLRFYKEEKVVIMGTGNVSSKEASLLYNLSSLLEKIFSGKKKSRLLYNLTNGMYDLRVRDGKLGWLSYNKKNIEDYKNDRLCSFMFRINGYKVLSEILKNISTKESIKKIDPSTKILLISGKDDPVGDFSKAVKKLYLEYRNENLDVKLKLIDSARHEILNENNKLEVYEYIKNFLEN